jgi:hypothetical protein
MGIPDTTKQKLKQLIRERTGISMTDMQDASKLSAEMAEKRLTLSPHTLGRLFGIIKQNRKHYRNTYENIARFLGFTDWEHLHTFLKDSPEVHNLNTHNGNYPTPLFKLALTTENTKSLQLLLDSFDPEAHAALRFQLANLLGNHIRNLPVKETMLSLLAGHPQGRFLFFESFVDEDNPEHYYSNALERFYLPQTNHRPDQLFATCFLFIQQVYGGVVPIPDFPKQFFTDLFNPELSYQQLSRLWECYFLVHAKAPRKKQIHGTLDNMLNHANGFPKQEKACLLGYFIRAFMFHKKGDLLLKHKEYVKEISQIPDRQNPFNYSMAECLIQALLIYGKKYTPEANQIRFTLYSDYVNELHHKVLLDSLTFAYLEKNPQKKAWMHQQIKQAGKSLNKNWINGFLEVQ